MRHSRLTILATALAASLTGTAGAADNNRSANLSNTADGYSDPRVENIEGFVAAIEPFDLSDPEVRSKVEPLVITEETYSHNPRFSDVQETLTHGRLVVVSPMGVRMLHTDAEGDLREVPLKVVSNDDE